MTVPATNTGASTAATTSPWLRVNAFLAHNTQTDETRPLGHRFSPAMRTDGRNSSGLTDAENIAYVFALIAYHGTVARPSTYMTAVESAAMQAADVAATQANVDAMDAWITTYRATHPLPTSLAALPISDPSYDPDQGSLLVLPLTTVPHSETSLQPALSTATVLVPVVQVNRMHELAAILTRDVGHWAIDELFQHLTGIRTAAAGSPRARASGSAAS